MKEIIEKCWCYMDGSEKKPTLELHTKKKQKQFNISLFQLMILHNEVEIIIREQIRKRNEKNNSSPPTSKENNK